MIEPPSPEPGDVYDVPSVQRWYVILGPGECREVDAQFTAVIAAALSGAEWIVAETVQASGRGRIEYRRVRVTRIC